MLSKKMEKALNDQLNAELYSGYIYLSMAAYFDSIYLSGCATWMRVQAKEELTHAMKFFDHINERGGRVTLTAVGEPPAKWAAPLAAFDAAYKHECKVTGLIHKLVELADAEKDHASRAFLQWFVNEQVEEEASTDEIVQKLTMIGDSKNGLLMLDHQLSKRGSE